MTQRLSAERRAAILKRDEYTCQSCGHIGNDDSISRGMEVHHIMPLAFGGTNESVNLVTLCAECHKERDVCAGTRQTTNRHRLLDPPILFNLSPIARQHLQELAHMHGSSQLQVLELAIDRMYQQERPIPLPRRTHSRA